MRSVRNFVALGEEPLEIYLRVGIHICGGVLWVSGEKKVACRTVKYDKKKKTNPQPALGRTAQNDEAA